MQKANVKYPREERERVGGKNSVGACLKNLAFEKQLGRVRIRC